MSSIEILDTNLWHLPLSWQQKQIEEVEQGKKWKATAPISLEIKHFQNEKIRVMGHLFDTRFSRFHRNSESMNDENRRNDNSNYYMIHRNFETWHLLWESKSKYFGISDMHPYEYDYRMLRQRASPAAVYILKLKANLPSRPPESRPFCRILLIMSITICEENNIQYSSNEIEFLLNFSET